MTTYDLIWESFLDNCGVDVSTLPSADEQKYAMIHNGIRHYNSVIDNSDTKLTFDDTNEEINIGLDDTRLLILAYCLKYVFLENDLVGFQQLWQPFQKEMGQKFYREQIGGRENTLERTTKKITELLTNIDDGTIM